MNKETGMYVSTTNVCVTVAFAFCMLIGNDFGSYLIYTFIVFSFVPMICTSTFYSSFGKKVVGNTTMIFAGMCVVFILLVYFAQVTIVRLDNLNEQAIQILSHPKLGLSFSYDLPGYGLMAILTFFTGLAVEAKTKPDKRLKWLLLIHGVLAIVRSILPTIGLPRTDMEGAEWIRAVVSVSWCVYFIPVSILFSLHSKNQ